MTNTNIENKHLFHSLSYTFTFHTLSHIYTHIILNEKTFIHWHWHLLSEPGSHSLKAIGLHSYTPSASMVHRLSPYFTHALHTSPNFRDIRYIDKTPTCFLWVSIEFHLCFGQNFYKFCFLSSLSKVRGTSILDVAVHYY